MIEKYFLSCLLVLLVCVGCGPALNKEPCPLTPAEASSGWDMQTLDRAFRHACELGSSTLVISTDGDIVRSMGNLSKPLRVHSVRKALLSALVGQHLGTGQGKIDLNSNLAELGIDDSPVPLTDLQKTTRVLHLVKSLSGINHPAAAEAGLMEKDKTRRLGRTPNVPGTKWAYNNWDYNTLTSIFVQQTGMDIYQAFHTGIARPIGMQDFKNGHVRYTYETHLSMHPKAGFSLSARDMLKFGQLYLNRGRWQGKEIIPAAWIDRITRDYTGTGRSGLRSAHGYLWWVPVDETSRRMGLPGGSYVAAGFGSQRLVVIPAWKTVIVHQVDTRPFFDCCTRLARERGWDVMTAGTHIVKTCRRHGTASEEFCRPCGWAFNFIDSGSFEAILEKILAARNKQGDNIN